ncbi:MarR family winged helix-turn-helix transcriptional regulator [Rubrivirga sp. IMCC45206]|uniref:MarR family winged helix-turn-helix transcriptional regulator n=1 Tax=Rubrivirga sp. IMCC45206 TaxID=3391614 RepID=UPI003990125F
MTLSELIQQDRFTTPSQEALLNVLATASWVATNMNAALAPHGVTQAQYNVLRILRGRHPDRYTCTEVGTRLLDRTPDVTRLLVRLEKRGFVRRERAAHDRRVVEVSITDAGLETLSRLDEPVETTIARLGSHLTEEELTQLSALLEKVRTDQTE